MKKVFVYGTLRKGLTWNYLLQSSKFLGIATTKEKYILYAEEFPFLLENQKEVQVIGEVYNVNEKTLARLDKLEGHPRFYYRKEIEVLLNDETILAWVYFFPNPKGVVIPSGNYLDYLK